MTAELEKAESSRARIERYISRSNCQPCDRAEAGYQLKRLREKTAPLQERLNQLTDGRAERE